MKAPKNLTRPSNWQDFETLCKKLWGEIWNCPEIQKNGRSGQLQNGVDICGVPFGDDGYYGIQCKGKDEYTNKQFTEKEILTEVERAKLFQPPLKKFYFSTTAVKDVGIEQFVRSLNIKHIKEQLFEVHLFSWEDIVDHIYENRHTYDWYVKSQNFKTERSVSVTFENNLSEITLSPKFQQVVTRFKLKDAASKEDISNFGRSKEQYGDDNYFPMMSSPIISDISEINRSYGHFCIRVKNTGDEPLEEYKLFLTFEGNIEDVADTNEYHTGLAGIRTVINHPDVTLFEDPFTGQVVPKNSILVGDDTYTSNEIFIKPVPVDTTVIIKWKLVSKNFKDFGELSVFLKPIIDKLYRDIEVNDSLKVCSMEGEIDEVIERLN